MSKLKLVVVNVIKSFASPVFGFLISITGIKNYGAQNWGQFVDVLLWVLFISLVLNWGNKEHLIRKYSKQSSKVFDLFFTNFYTRGHLLILNIVLFIAFPFETAFLTSLYISLMFIYNSLDSLVIYHQKFQVQLVAECLGFICLITTLFCFSFNLNTLITAYCIAFFLKNIVLIYSLELWKKKRSYHFSINEFKEANSFFLIILTGWLASKIDLYIVGYLFPKKTLSVYQIFISSFLMLQGLSAYILIPFNKHLYRVNNMSLKRIQNKMSFLSIPIVLLGSMCIWIIIEFFADIHLEFSYYILGSLLVLPCYFYILDTARINREKQEKTIVLYSFIAFIISFLFSFLLAKPYGLKGILIGTCISQWVLLILYKLKK